MRQPHATDDRRLHVLVFGAFRPLRLAAALGRAAGTTERTGRAAALTGTATAATATAGTAAETAAAARGRAAATGRRHRRRRGSYRRHRRRDHRDDRPGRRRDRGHRAGPRPPPGRAGRHRAARRADAGACCRAWRRAAGAAGARAHPDGAGACGRGIGRSTGCCEENGLLPTRGVRAAGLGAGTRAADRALRRVRAGRGRCGAAGAGRRVPPVRAARPPERGAGAAGCAGRARPAWAPARPARAPSRRPLAGRLGRAQPLPSALTFSAARLRAAERLTQPARDGGLHRGGRGFDEFALFAQSGEDFLAGDTEFLCQLVYAGLTCHYISCLEATAVVGAAPRV